MRRTVAVAIAAGLSAIAARAHAGGELYMGMSLGPSGAGHDRAFDERFDSRGHAAVGFVLGGDIRGFTLDFTMIGAGYSVRAAPTNDAAILWFGGDVGRRVWLGDRLALGASLGLHAAFMLPWADDDIVPDKLRGSGESWTASARLEYRLGSMPPLAPNYHGPVKSLNASLVLEVRRERMFLEFDDFEAEPAVTLVTIGLRGGLSFW